MFNQKYLEDHDVIERYLADQLPEAERESFEAYFLQHPEVVQEMNRTAKLKAALIDLNVAGRLQPLLAPAQPRISSVKIAVVLGVATLLLLIWWLQR